MEDVVVRQRLVGQAVHGVDVYISIVLFKRQDHWHPGLGARRDPVRQAMQVHPGLAQGFAG
jgi:hypothetical protein